ncbi:MAG TPA: UDP-N-acetylmuramate dehydrogenase [Lacisediminihabitans sp.]|uniref:UDP-N-acetylmuramate dehydrogenase n=1 Tax=Lacisediminihabitans sp. TaxID=2787631 RepID=UPI002EDB6A48
MNLSELTTLRVGGPADRVYAPTTPGELVRTALDVWATDDEWLLLGGGSNVVVADEGLPGSLIRVVTRGIETLEVAGDEVVLRVQAGEPWDALVAHTVENGLAGLEALSGIPGSSGAAPIQNIGAYGQELAASLVSVEFLSWDTGELLRVPVSELELGYRTSALKRGRRGLVVSIDLRLGRTGMSTVRYPQLATALGVAFGESLPVASVRAAVLALRAGKGMLLDAADPDSVSAGSFFTNPIVSEEFARGLPADAPRWPTEPERAAPIVAPLESFRPEDLPPIVPARRRMKLSAAWLIEHSGVPRGFRLPGSRAAVSSKHSLALVNTGDATAAEIAELARYIQAMVLGAYGVILQPEPVLVGVQL